MTGADRPPPPHRPAGGGLLLVDKPGGCTSHDVVGRLRRVLQTRRVGHAGTLDPMATGLLVVAVDRSTKLLGHLALTTKTYTATIRLGVATDSDDADGDVVTAAAPGAVAAVTGADIAAGIAGLTGNIRQVPSSVSAIKVAGRRAYDLARAGETVQLAARPVTVSRFDLLGPPRHGRTDDGAHEVLDLDVLVDCSSGTYIRALARDLGATLGVGGHLTALRRTAVGPFVIDDAVDVFGGADRHAPVTHEFAAALAARIIPAVDAVRSAFRIRALSAVEAEHVRHGRAIPPLDPHATEPTAGGPVYGAVGPDGALVALMTDRDGTARPVLGWAAGA